MTKRGVGCGASDAGRALCEERGGLGGGLAAERGSGGTARLEVLSERRHRARVRRLARHHLGRARVGVRVEVRVRVRARARARVRVRVSVRWLRVRVRWLRVRARWLSLGGAAPPC